MTSNMECDRKLELVALGYANGTIKIIALEGEQTEQIMFEAHDCEVLQLCFWMGRG